MDGIIDSMNMSLSGLWQIDGEKVETLISTFTSSEKNTYFVFLGSKITADGVFSHKIKRHLLLGTKVVTNLDNILKSKTSLCWQRYT